MEDGGGGKDANTQSRIYQRLKNIEFRNVKKTE